MKKFLVFLCMTLLVLGLFGGASAAPIRMAGVGGNYGYQAANDVFSYGDLDGSIDRITYSSFNSLTVDYLIATYDVLLITWATSSALNADWSTRLLPYLNAGGGVIWEDPNNLSDISAIISYHTGVDYGPYSVTSVSGLTDGITNDLWHDHFGFGIDSWASFLNPFITDSYEGDIVGLYGDVGSGRIVINGVDADYHAIRGGSGYYGNQYNLLLNEIEWVSSGEPIPEPATMLLLGSGLVGLAGFRRKKKK